MQLHFSHFQALLHDDWFLKGAYCSSLFQNRQSETELFSELLLGLDYHCSSASQTDVSEQKFVIQQYRLSLSDLQCTSFTFIVYL